MESIKTKQNGFIKIVLLFILGILIISYLGIDLESAVGQKLFMKNLVYTKNKIVETWKDFIMEPLNNWFKKKEGEVTATGKDAVANSLLDQNNDE
jgi:hypothetical protein